MKKKSKLAIMLMVIVVAGIYYYVALPAFNIHSSETWFFIMALAVIGLVYYTIRKKPGKGSLIKRIKGFREYFDSTSCAWCYLSCGNTVVFSDCKCKEIPEANGSTRRRICRRCRRIVL